ALLLRLEQARQVAVVVERPQQDAVDAARDARVELLGTGLGRELLAHDRELDARLVGGSLRALVRRRDVRVRVGGRDVADLLAGDVSAIRRSALRTAVGRTRGEGEGGGSGDRDGE